MQLGFVIDHSRCIGCHACTVACKTENDVPVGSFRTWVKHTERGTFPEVRRSFAVLRCNQCTDAPCVTICPTRALEKRADGIVDVDPDHCIGCKGCMQACPYDALYIDDRSGTAAKCHFCAHRTERGLAPACAVVCPTEAILPGDFDDPESLVSRLRREGELVARKTEAGTGPNVWYREVDPAGVRPLATQAAGGYLWAQQAPGLQLEADEFRALERRAEARTTYDVEHAPVWGGRVSAYLVTKSIAAGAFLAALPRMLAGGADAGLADAAWTGAIAAVALAALAATTALLVADLKRPARFLHLLLRPNPRSWLVRGAWVLVAYGALATGWLARSLLASGDGLAAGPPARLAAVATAAVAALCACYTAFLFAQAKGRVLWMQRGLGAELLLHAVVAGAGLLLVLGGGWTERLMLAGGLAGMIGFELARGRLAPRGRAAVFAETIAIVERGPLRRRRATAIAAAAAALALALVPVSGALALVPLAAAWLAVALSEDLLVRAGQALRIS